MEPIEKLMLEWKCQDVLPDLKANRVSIERLQYLTEEDIRDIIPIVGLRAEFRAKLSAWKNINPSTTASEIEVHRNNLALGSPAVGSFFINVIQLLNESSKGAAILQFYKNNSFLLESHRVDLVNLIIERLLEKEIKLKLDDYSIITAQIVQAFPKENPDIYYQKRKADRNASGKLYDKYRNLARRYNKIRPTGAVNTDFDNDSYGDEFDFNELNAIKNSFKIDISAVFLNGSVSDSWKRTFPLRQKDLKESDSNVAFMATWPAFKEAFGSKLIESDFDMLFPKRSSIYDKWDFFKKQVVLYFEDNIKDKKSRENLSSLKHLTNKDSVNCCTIQLLNSILLPTARFKSAEGNKSKKFTIADAQQSLVLHVICVNDVFQKVQALKEKFYMSNTTLQPLIIVVGANVYQLSEFYVYFDGVLYKLHSFLKTLSTCFKIFHVLNLKYTAACRHVWLFIQKYFFEIDSEFDFPSPSVHNLISFLDKNKN